MQEGMQEGIIRTAKNLIREGAEMALVEKVTGLSKSQIEKLKQDIDN